MYLNSTSSSTTLPAHKSKLEIGLEQALAKFARIPISRWQFVIRALLLLVLCITLSKLFWLLVPAPRLPAAVASVQVVVAATPSSSSINIEELKTLQLFGQAPAKAAAVSETQAVDSHLNLVLMGVMMSSDEKLSHAIISMGDKQDIFAVGTALPVGNNVTLSKVMNDRAIINNNGQAETLWLYGNDSNNSVVYAAAPPAMPPADYSANQDTADPALAQAAHSLADVISGSVERDRTNGSMLGYRIRPGRDAAKFQQMGLQPDDLVTAINGTPLTNPATLMQIYKNMGNTTSANLEIKRGGTVLTIPIRL